MKTLKILSVATMLFLSVYSFGGSVNTPLEIKKPYDDLKKEIVYKLGNPELAKNNISHEVAEVSFKLTKNKEIVVSNVKYVTSDYLRNWIVKKLNGRILNSNVEPGKELKLTISFKSF